MLSLYRKYQRYIYLVITVVMIISFSFFGTYSTLGSNKWREQVAFKAINGDEVTRFEVEEMNTFLSSDNQDKLNAGGVWGPNFLNDGVIKKDFLETGLAQELLLAYQDEIKDEWLKKLEKEKKFVLYTHPQAPFIGTLQAWNYFFPEMNTHFETLKNSEDPLTQDTINSRIQLYLSQEKIPSNLLKKILKYQEQQFDWIKPDQSLDVKDLSLFGYHHLSDWFSTKLTPLVSEFIINAAILAEEKGYRVSNEEVMADFIQKTQASYMENLNNPYLSVASPQEYFNEQLRLLNMDQAAAIKVWKQVLLFRRYFEDVGYSVFLETLTFKNFNQYVSETSHLDLYRLSPSVRLDSAKALEKFNLYLQAVAKNHAADSLELPKEFLSVDEVAKNYPELVQTNFILEISHVNLKSLQSKISVKDLWFWETQDKNWQILREKFPELGIRKAESVEERFDILEEMSPSVRERVDQFSKGEMVLSHPEWIDAALSNAERKKVEVGVKLNGESLPFEGILDASQKQAVLQALTKAPIDQEPDAQSFLYSYTPDNKNYYRVTVLDRANQPTIVTFAEVNQDKILETLKDKILEKEYASIRENNKEAYQKEDKTWKAFKAVKEEVAKEYFANLWNKIEEIRSGLATSEPIYSSLGKDQLAALRFYPFFKEAQEKIAADPSTKAYYILNKKENLNQESLLSDQWKLIEEKIAVNRTRSQPYLDPEEVAKLSVGEWSTIKPTFNGDLIVFQVLEKKEESKDIEALANQTRQAQKLLSSSAQKTLMREILEKVKDKKAISLAYLKIEDVNDNEN